MKFIKALLFVSFLALMFCAEMIGDYVANIGGEWLFFALMATLSGCAVVGLVWLVWKNFFSNKA